MLVPMANALSVVVATLAVATTSAFAPLKNQGQPTSSLCAMAHEERCDIAIFGGGFGGLYTALSLSRQARSKGQRLDVALVDPSDRFIFLPLLYDLVVGTASEAEVCPTYEELLEDTGVRHVQASFTNFTSPDYYSANVTKVGGDPGKLTFRASVVSVGATPQSTLASIPGASEYTQPFYDRQNAYDTKTLLEKLERRVQNGLTPRIAIVGGGYAGVELSACVKRRLRDCDVTLLSRSAPMKGTRAEVLVDKALARLGVKVEICGVQSVVLEKQSSGARLEDRLRVSRTQMDGQKTPIDDPELWDAVLWTAGSGPACPVSEGILGLKQVEGSGRLVTDSSLRCVYEQGESRKPPVWALGDCAQIDNAMESYQVPKTAQAAIQQADVVALNVMSDIRGTRETVAFKYQDLGSMLSLGGPNGAVLAPKEDSAFYPIFSTLLDTSRTALDLADEVLTRQGRLGSPLADNLGLSLGGYGLGVETDSAPGTLSGTLSGAARRAIYSVRMPTNRQRAKAAILGAFSSATALSKEFSDQLARGDDLDKRDDN